MKVFFRWLIRIFLVALLCVVGYVAYVFLDYGRIPDHQVLQIEQKGADKELSTGQTYVATTYNIGFGAYLPDFSFFMDGGESSWAKSEASVKQDIHDIGRLIEKENPDFALFQEVDLKGTRSYGVNQYDILRQYFENYSRDFAVNYDSSFLFYPIWQPHGKNKSGLATFSKNGMLGAERRSLPISTGFSKFFDLDRAYSVQRFAVENDKELILINVHLSAYSKDASIRNAQIAMLVDEMEAAYQAGNYVIVGGDFNHDLLASEDQTDNEISWAYPFPRSALGEHFSLALDSLTADEKANLWLSARNADEPYQEGHTFTVMLDGFIVSDNIQVSAYNVLKTGYAYSDHDPVEMSFTLKN